MYILKAAIVKVVEVLSCFFFLRSTNLKRIPLVSQKFYMDGNMKEENLHIQLLTFIQIIKHTVN